MAKPGLVSVVKKAFGFVSRRYSLEERPPAINKTDLFGWASIDDNLKGLTYALDPDVVLKGLKKHRADLELLLTDPDVKQAVNTRLDALIATPFRLEPGEGALSDFIWDNLTSFMPQIMEHTMRARLYGYSVAERVYQYDLQGRIILKDIRSCDIRKFRFTPADELEIQLNGNWKKVDVTSKYLVSRCSPTINNPYGDALLSSLYWTWKFKNDSQRFLMQYLERCGIPMLVGKTARDTKKMAVALKKAYQDAILAIDAADDVSFVSTAAKGSSSDLGFIGVDNMFAKKILIMILGQTLTTTTDGSGSRALGEVQDKVRMDKRDSDVRLGTPAAQNVVNALTWLNWDITTKPPIVTFGDDTGLDLERAKRDVEYLRTGKIKLTRRYLVNKTDLEDEDFVLEGEPGFGQSNPADKNKESAGGASGQAGDLVEGLDNVEKAEKGDGSKLMYASRLELAQNLIKLAGKSKYTGDEKAIEAAVVALARETEEDFDVSAVADAVLSTDRPEDLIGNLYKALGVDLLKALDPGSESKFLELMTDAYIYGELAE